MHPKTFRQYEGVTIAKNDYFGNRMRIQEANVERDIGRHAGPVDRDEWGMNPQTVNAYYTPVLNQIVFPAAILQPPFFDLNADEAINYGAIGAVIGHEIGHGVDDQGSNLMAMATFEIGGRMPTGPNLKTGPMHWWGSTIATTRSPICM